MSIACSPLGKDVCAFVARNVAVAVDVNEFRSKSERDGEVVKLHARPADKLGVLDRCRLVVASVRCKTDATTSPF